MADQLINRKAHHATGISKLYKKRGRKKSNSSTMMKVHNFYKQKKKYKRFLNGAIKSQQTKDLATHAGESIANLHC